METIIRGWLSIWLYVMAAVGFLLGVKIWKNRKTWSKLNIYGTLVIIVLILHVMEEWVLPGGLHYSYNIAHGSTLLSAYPMNRLTDMITNFGAVIIGCIVLKCGGFKKPSGLVAMFFCAMEVFMHIKIGIQDMQIFAKFGMNTLYSPGIVTSLFGFLPVGVALAVCLFKEKGDRPKLSHWLIAIIASVALSFLLINLPEAVFSDENTPYEFTNRGYYEQYAEQFEQENGFEYYEPKTNLN